MKCCWLKMKRNIVGKNYSLGLIVSNGVLFAEMNEISQEEFKGLVKQ